MKEQIKNIKNKTWIEHGSAEGSKVQFFFCFVENDSFVLAHWWFMVNVYVLWADYQVPGMHREMGVGRVSGSCAKMRADGDNRPACCGAIWAR